MIAGDLVDQVAEILQDLNNVTWTKPEILRGLSRGAELVAMYRPDASVKIDTVELQPSVMQTLPQEAHRFFDAICNMGNGSEEGRVIRVVDKAVKDLSDSRWMARQASSEIDEVVIDERAPKNYWTSPKPLPNTHIQIGYTVAPAPMTNELDTLPISDQYAPAIIEWALYVALSRDSEETPNYQRAMDHKQTFFNMMGVKTQADNSTSANSPVAGKVVPPA